MQHDVVIPLPLLGSATQAPNHADLVGGVQVRICADNVCSLQVSSLPDFCAYATDKIVAIALHVIVAARLMLLSADDSGDDDVCLHLLHPPPPFPPLPDRNKHLSRRRR